MVTFVVAVQEAGWTGKQNGELLKLAETGRTISIVVLQSSSNRLDHLRQFFPACLSAIEKINPAKSFEWATLPEESDSESTTYLCFNDC